MNEAKWRMIVDPDGVTIAGDRFQLRTTRPVREEASGDPDALFADFEPVDMEEVLAELQAMTRGSYGQFCGLSRAMEMIGERWALLIIRDLFVGPKSFAELRAGLPRISPGTLTARLTELERTGVVRRQGPQPSPEAVVYELTPYGLQLEAAIAELARWGARSLGEPRPDDIVTVDSMIMALRTTFHPEAARGFTAGYELRLGEMVIHARIDDGALRVAQGPLPDADLVIEPGMALRALMAGELDPAEAVRNGSVRITGDPALLTRFTEIFTFRAEPSLVAT